MTKIIQTTSALTIPLILLSLLSSNALAENLKVLTDDGREVLLKDDGSWAFRSTDRFANTEDGRRVRLKEDGSWLYTGEKPQSQPQPVPVATSDLDIQLNRVVIEKYEKKAQKYTRVKTQTVFYIVINYPSSADKVIRVNKDDTSQIEVKDSNGTNYSVLSIDSDRSHLTPGTTTTIEVRVNKSPTILDDVTAMQITLKPGTFGLQQAVTLTQKLNDFEEEYVDGFE